MMPFAHISQTTVYLVFAICSLSKRSYGQGCSNTCPPINYGTVVPALCEGDSAENLADLDKTYNVCHPTESTAVPNQNFRMNDFRGPGRVTVLASYYTGCNAGRRESGVFAHVAQRFYDMYGDRAMFIQSVKGGGTCDQWAGMYRRDATSLYPGSEVTPGEMPLLVSDANYEIRDDFFTTPFGHPSYVVLDGDLQVRHKFIGPCCGYERFLECTADIAKALDTELSGYIESILGDSTNGIGQTGYTGGGRGGQDLAINMFDPGSNVWNPGSNIWHMLGGCRVGAFSEWSSCSLSCGTSPGIQFRWRSIQGDGCPAPVETRTCQPPNGKCLENGSCVAEFGQTWRIETIANGFHSPRDVAFHPTPGLHLGEYSEGRSFYPNEGEEAWVVNGGNHSVSIVASLGTERQTTVSRRDRGYYHYMINGTALAFNAVSNSNRSPDRDSFNYWAICNDNLNTYLDAKEANYFMGPTLYNSHPKNRNTVNRLGEECKEEEPCYFLHSDMLHEAPACIGIAHDPETLTAYGNVYWAFDATGNREKGQLVRFDFQQPHGPGSMDHSIAAIRRYVEVELERGPLGVHAGMVVHDARREVYIAVPGGNKIVVVGADSGTFARTAREEYPIYSSRLPSFEYSIWECTEQKVFADGIQMPTGLALGPDGERLFVAERDTGNILVFEVGSGSLLHSIGTGYRSIGGLAFSPSSGILHFVDEETNSLNSVHPATECRNPFEPRTDAGFLAAVAQAQETLGDKFSLSRDYQCVVDPVIPDSTFFDQVHVDTGYASDNPDVQSTMAGMDETAALLATRSDCERDSELNFDALLLGGYFCHQCLPDQDLTCDTGGVCTNVQWLGYVCDNEFIIMMTSTDGSDMQIQSADGTVIEPSSVLLKRGVTYRFTVLGDIAVCIMPYSGPGGDSLGCASKGPLLLEVDENVPSLLYFTVENIDQPVFQILVDTGATTTLSSYLPVEPMNLGGASWGPILGIATTALAWIVVGQHFL